MTTTPNTTASGAADLTPEIEYDCLVAWNRSVFGANQHDTVHPMYLTAFKSGYKAALAASAPVAPAPQPAAHQGDVVAWMVLADGEPHHVTPGKSDDAARLWAEDQTKCGAPYNFTFLPLCPPAAPKAAPAPAAEGFDEWLEKQFEFRNYYYNPRGPGLMAVPFARRAYEAGRAQAAQPEGGAK